LGIDVQASSALQIAAAAAALFGHLDDNNKLQTFRLVMFIIIIIIRALPLHDIQIIKNGCWQWR